MYEFEELKTLTEHTKMSSRVTSRPLLADGEIDLRKFNRTADMVHEVPLDANDRVYTDYDNKDLEVYMTGYILGIFAVFCVVVVAILILFTSLCSRKRNVQATSSLSLPEIPLHECPARVLIRCH
ncbi:hypothetical protein J6590_022584 [Homalodisca vitripennis]|nr:hypothetical protein J6590_022584 [Homalodisca vitripennis]